MSHSITLGNGSKNNPDNPSNNAGSSKDRDKNNIVPQGEASKRGKLTRDSNNPKLKRSK